MSMVTQLIAAVMDAEGNIDEQLAKLDAYSTQNKEMMEDITNALSGSGEESAAKMIESITMTQAAIADAVQKLNSSKLKLVRVRTV